MTSTALTRPQKYIIVSSMTIFFTSVKKWIFFLVNKYRKLLLHLSTKQGPKQAKIFFGGGAGFLTLCTKVMQNKAS